MPQSLLNGRTAGAIEFKHQNIRAILIEQGFPYIDGYEPCINCGWEVRRRNASTTCTATSGNGAVTGITPDYPAEPIPTFMTSQVYRIGMGPAPACGAVVRGSKMAGTVLF